MGTQRTQRRAQGRTFMVVESPALSAPRDRCLGGVVNDDPESGGGGGGGGGGKGGTSLVVAEQDPA